MQRIERMDSMVVPRSARACPWGAQRRREGPAVPHPDRRAL